jgi:hypothetical protein
MPKQQKSKHESHLTISLITAPEYDLLLAIDDSILNRNALGWSIWHMTSKLSMTDLHMPINRSDNVLSITERIMKAVDHFAH